MLEKPFVLSLLLMLFSFLLSFPMSLVNKILPQSNNSLWGLFLAVVIVAFFIGVSHSRQYKTKFSIKERLKTVLYYFILNVSFTLVIVLLMTANTTVKGAPLYNIYELILIFEILYNFLALSFFVYISLDLGCIAWLKYKKIEIQEEEMEFNNLKKTPLFLSSILLFSTYFINLIIPVSSMFVKDPFSPIKLCIVAFLAAICVGWNTEIKIIDRVKISLYAFLFYNVYAFFLLFASGGKAIINSVVFFEHPYLLQYFKFLVLNLAASASIYIGLGVGKRISEVFNKTKRNRTV